MKFTVKVKPNSKEQKVEKFAKDVYKVWVKSAPEKGKANQELRQILADHFSTSKTAVRIVVGHKTKNKLVEIKGR